jgi:catechol 2,3-dioxygenase-like lactoylglutathione lyase family enzyme
VSTLTSHLVTRDPAAAAAWYGSVLGAVEERRIVFPGGRVLSIDLRFGDSRLAIADEFPDLGIVSPVTLGGTYGALHLAVQDAEAVWQRVLAAGPGGGRDGVRAVARRILGRPDRPVHRPVRAPLGHRPACPGRASGPGRPARRRGLRPGRELMRHARPAAAAGDLDIRSLLRGEPWTMSPESARCGWW